MELCGSKLETPHPTNFVVINIGKRSGDKHSLWRSLKHIKHVWFLALLLEAAFPAGGLYSVSFRLLFCDDNPYVGHFWALVEVLILIVQLCTACCSSHGFLPGVPGRWGGCSCPMDDRWPRFVA